MLYKRNVDDMDWAEMGHGRRFHNQRKMLTPMGEGFMPKLGISLYRLAPGKRAFPFHMHMANDEALLIMSGTGSLRYGDDKYPVKEGDYVHLPAGSGKAHQLLNSGAEPLTYYCLSSLLLPEVVHYPDTGKMATVAMMQDEAGNPVRTLAVYRPEAADYWDGEAEE